LKGRLVVSGFTISLDGYGAGPRQSLDDPLGMGAESLHAWLVNTSTFKRMHGGSADAAATGIDEEFAARSMEGMGAWIMGRNMFGPIRGAWPDESWRGWWGEDTPYHTPVFVLTHHERRPLEMKGGNVFHFVTGGIDAALDRARKAAGGKDIRVGGGVSVVRQYLQSRLIDELNIAVSPILLGSGEHLFGGLDLRALGYRCTDSVAGERAVHYTIEKA